MIRRPLWNRGGGVFVEEASWNVPLDGAPADLSPQGPDRAPQPSPADQPERAESVGPDEPHRDALPAVRLRASR